MQTRRPIVVGCVLAGALVAASLAARSLLGAPPAEPLPHRLSAPPMAASARTEDLRAQVEEAYLTEWDRYADAALRRDPSGLSAVLAGDALEAITAQVAHFPHPVWVRIDHSYTITLYDETTAFVEDTYRNHSVFVDPATMRPLEADPDERVHQSFTLRKEKGRWMLTDIVSS